MTRTPTTGWRNTSMDATHPKTTSLTLAKLGKRSSSPRAPLPGLENRGKASGICFSKFFFGHRFLVSNPSKAAVDNPQDVAVISGKPQGQRAILKFAANTGATPVAGRYTPGAFTNQNQTAFREPRLLLVTDPRIDHQPRFNKHFNISPTKTMGSQLYHFSLHSLSRVVLFKNN